MKIFNKQVLSLVWVSFCFIAVNLSAGEPISNKSTAVRGTLSFTEIRAAAERGDADAQYALGYMYYYGKSGATKNIIEAKKWISKAAAQKQPQAVKALALLNRQQVKSPYPTEKTTFVRNEQQDSKGFASRVVSQPPESAVTSSKKIDHQMILVDRRNLKVSTQPETSSMEYSQTSPKNSLNMAGGYTLQLLGAYQKEQIVKLIQKYHLNAATIYQTSYNDKNWYVLLYGRYKTREEATNIGLKLEKQLDLKPWAKPFSSIRDYKKLEP